MCNLYRQSVTFGSWQMGDDQSSLVEIADVRDPDFGTALLAQFKAHARITYNYDDAILPNFINAAIMELEQFLEFPILPRSFSWNVGTSTTFEKYEVPLRNSKATGQQYDFEPLRGKVIINKPASWPVELVVGFDSIADIPPDLKLAILNVSATYEQLRSTIELSAADLSGPVISRYGVMRV
jgi:hypothetical protein